MGDSLRGTISDLHADGRGVAELGRKTAFVSQAYPGEEVIFEIDRKTKRELAGRVKRFVHKNDNRIEHSCANEFKCTGCPLLAYPLNDEKSFKESKIRSVFDDVGIDLGACEFQFKIPSEAFGYRHYAKQVFGVCDGRVVLGSYVAGTHFLADNENCPVLTDELQRLLAEVADQARSRKMRAHRDNDVGLRFAVARHSRSSGEVLLVLSTSDKSSEAQLNELAQDLLDRNSSLVSVTVLHNEAPGNSLLSGDELFQIGKSSIVETLLGFEFEIGPRSFFQINPVAAEILFKEALQFAGHGERCLELFSGVGALTFGLASQFKEIKAVELSAEAVESLNLRKTQLGLDSITAHCGDGTVLGSELLDTFSPETCLADPPRKGLGEPLCKALGASSLKRLVLLSCEPQSLKRDLPWLLDEGFKVSAVSAIDQFPRTAHVETVMLLER